MNLQIRIAFMRGKKKIRRDISPDPVYNNVTVAKFINHVMRKGKKTVARKIVYGAFDAIKEETKQDPLEVFERALKNVTPFFEVRARRIGGATYQIPIRVKEERARTLAMRWIIQAAKSKKGRPMFQGLTQELIDAFNKTGKAVLRRRDTHRMAEANKAFSHLAW